MDLKLGEAQRALADSVAGALRRRYGFEARRALLRAPLGGPGVWPLLSSELGLAGLMIAAGKGGQGGSAVDAMLVMEAIGRRLVLDAFAECCILVPAVLRNVHARRHILSAIARAERRVLPVFAEAGFGGGARPAARRTEDGFRIEGGARFVVGGPSAGHFLVAVRGLADLDDGLSLLLVDAGAEGLSRRDYRMVDGREASDLQFSAVRAPRDALLGRAGAARGALAAGRDAGIAALCAEAVGVMREMLAITIGYTGQRRQFGVPISSFQAVQHRIADMAMALEKADAITLRATLMLDRPAAERAQAIAAAKVLVSESVRTVAQSAVQLHGGIGTAEETPITHYFRRATVIEGQFGSGAHHLARYAKTVAAG